LRCCPAAHPKVRILIFARSHYLRVDLWQRLGGPPPLRRTGHDRSNAIHDDPKAHIGTIGNKASLCAYEQFEQVPLELRAGAGATRGFPAPSLFVLLQIFAEV